MRARHFVPAVLAAAALSLVVSLGTSSAQSTQHAAAGTLTVGSAQGIPQLNPVIRTFAWEEVLFPLLWTGLTKWTPAGGTAPDLATSWSGTKDSKTWTFKLRSGLKFSNGDPLTSADVVKTFNYYLDDKTVTQEKNRINMIRLVTAVNPTTVKFALKTANALFPTAIINVKIVKTDDLANFSKSPITTGPYKVSAFVPDSTVTLVPNPNYYGHAARLTQINIVKAADATAATASLQSGDLDVLWAVPATEARKIKSDTGGAVKLVTPLSASQSPFWEMDTTSPPFNNVKNREALAYAVDRATILKAAYGGLGLVSPTNSLLSATNPSFGAPKGKKLIDYSYNLAKAKKLFAEGGVKAGSTLTWWSTPVLPEFQTSGLILQASLAKIGIKLVIENHEVATWVAKFYPGGKKFPGLVIPNANSGPVEPAYNFNFYLPTRCECNWSPPEFNAAYSAALQTAGLKQRIQAWHRVQSIENREVPIIVPFQSQIASAVRKSVTGAWVEGGGQLHLESAGNQG
jgi:peptide/nickel transport system substrate-binding protein